MTRRKFFYTTSGALALVLGGTALWRGRGGAAKAAEEHFSVTHTRDEWKKLLSPEAFAVLRDEDTEAPFTSPLLEEHRAGVFHCAGCDLPLYSSKVKFDSGTGWPSFWESLPDAIGTMVDKSLVFEVRTECHCARCGGHLGHIFDDGPPPTGMRHCINGVALKFAPGESGNA